MKLGSFDFYGFHYFFKEISHTFCHQNKKERGEWVSFPDAMRRGKVG